MISRINMSICCFTAQTQASSYVCTGKVIISGLISRIIFSKKVRVFTLSSRINIRFILMHFLILPLILSLAQSHPQVSLLFFPEIHPKFYLSHLNKTYPASSLPMENIPNQKIKNVESPHPVLFANSPFSDIF